MQHVSLKRFAAPFLAAIALCSSPAHANGDWGDEVNHLKDHIPEYTREVHWIIEQVDGIVATYEKKGAKAAKPEKVVDLWEAVEFHGAIETSYVPVYAMIWQGLFGVRVAIEQGKPIAEVRAQQEQLELHLWQGLGAVRMKAEYQAGNVISRKSGEMLTPADTLKAINHNLERVIAKHAEKAYDDAKEIVFSTYLERFEGLEGALIEQDAALVEDLEKDFNVTLPQAIDGKVATTKVREIVTAMQEKLGKAGALLAKADAERADVF